MGLAIAERVARLLDHPIGLRSWEGRGSVFWISLPMGDPAAVRRPAAPATEPALPQQALQVLVVDNEPAVLEGMSALLQRWGYAVVPHSGAAGDLSRLIEAPPPDLALVDYHLDEGASGIALLERLQRVWSRRVPGIVITADHTDAAREAAAAAGYDVLPKPVSPARLRALIQRVIETAER